MSSRSWTRSFRRQIPPCPPFIKGGRSTSSVRLERRGGSRRVEKPDARPPAPCARLPLVANPAGLLFQREGRSKSSVRPERRGGSRRVEGPDARPPQPRARLPLVANPPGPLCQRGKALPPPLRVRAGVKRLPLLHVRRADVDPVPRRADDQLVDAHGRRLLGHPADRIAEIFGLQHLGTVFG